MVGFWTGAGRIQDDSGASCGTRKEESTQNPQNRQEPTERAPKEKPGVTSIIKYSSI